MKKYRGNTLLAGVSFCIFVLIALLCYWILNLIHVQRVQFNRSINTALEKTLVADRNFRTDSIAKAMYRWIMDTSLTTIRSYKKLNSGDDLTVYYIGDKRHLNGKQTAFSFPNETRAILTDTSEVKKSVAVQIVKVFSESYRDYQSVYYFTNTLGDSATVLSNKLKLNISGFKLLLKRSLSTSGIKTDFSIHFISSKDSAEIKKNRIQSDKFTSLQTQLYKTDILINQDLQYVYAVFDMPNKWIIAQTILPISISLIILIFSGILLFHLYITVKRHKQLINLKNDFIDNMTHELKTPVAIISSAAEAMQHFGVLSDEGKTQKYLANIRKQSAHLHTIVDKVLGITLYESGTIALEIKEIHLNDMFIELTTELLNNSTKGEIIVDCGTENGLIYGDPFHIKNSFFNLLDNGLKYNDKEYPKIHVSIKDISKSIVISVKDNGKGIPYSHVKHVFDKFFRVPQGNVHAVRGFGIGLFYTKNIIETHGGTIEVQSAPGEGTTFTICLPKNKSNTSL